MAGASKEMGEALLINPFHLDDFARALEQALTMPVEEQVRRNQILQDRLRRYDVNRWADEFVQALLATQKTEAARSARLADGQGLLRLAQTLSLRHQPCAVPGLRRHARALCCRHRAWRGRTRNCWICLSRLGSDPGNDVVIVSGRPRRDLEEWFGRLPLSLVAEHGVWLRPRGGDWRMFKNITAEWKDRVRPILQLYVDRLPGALLEEKDFSLAWHYRRADPEQARVRAQELLDTLADYTRNIDVQVLEGRKVIEVRPSGINKGTAAQEWLKDRAPDFILGIGDDWTDEDLFRALPRSGLLRPSRRGQHRRDLLFERS